MGKGLTRAGRRLTGRGLQRLFAATIVLPGVLLTLIGLRAWLQDGELTQQRLRERVERTADLTQRAVEAEWRAWQRVLTEAQHGWPPTLDALPASTRRAFLDGGTAVLLRAAPAREVQAWPEGQLAYRATPPADRQAETPRTALLDAAARAEWQDRDYVRAAALYGRHAEQTPPEQRPAATLQQARALRKAGQHEAARRTYASLTTTTARIGPVPVDLVARYELAMFDAATPGAVAHEALLAFYQDLVEGRWSLEPTRYHFYSEQVRAALGAAQAQASTAHWRAVEERKLRLADAARAVATGVAVGRSPESGIVLLRDAGAPEVALLVTSDGLRRHVWAPVVVPTTQAGYDVTVRGAGATWLDTATQGERDAAIQVRRVLDIGDGDWQLTVSPRDPDALMSDVTRWRTLTLVMLLFVVVLLASGTYLTARVVRRELEVARLQADFVSAVSHEFRSPLTGIRQLGEMLLRGRVPDDGRRHEYYERITQESARLSRLVENLLQAAQIDDGQREHRAEPIDTSEWLQAVIDEARTQPALRHATIEAAIPADLPAITGDRQALSSAMHNLIDNAVKYSPGGTSVRVDAHADGDHVTIGVHDRGVGMSEDDRRHVFERFRRGRDPITQQVKGSGLGLSLVDDIVRAHGGHVDCESRPGGGTTFRMRLATTREGG